MTKFFFDAMEDEPEAIAILERELGTLLTNKNLILADRPGTLILATRSVPGSLYEGLVFRAGIQRSISYAMFTHSTTPMPGATESLEIQRFDFDDKGPAAVLAGLADGVDIPADVQTAVRDSLAPALKFDLDACDRLLSILWLNNPRYVRTSPPQRVAEVLKLLWSCERSNGLYLDIEPTGDGSNLTRLLFAVVDPPHKGYLAQVVEILNRFDVGIRSADVLAVATGVQSYALFAMRVRPRKGGVLEPGSALHHQLQSELFNTQMLAADSLEYRKFVVAGTMSGEDASLGKAFVAFCHTQLAHAEPDRFDWDEVENAFHANVPMLTRFVELFRLRFDPASKDREAAYTALHASTAKAVDEYDTGHAHLDELRRSIFRCCLTFIKHVLKTNFFVKEKQALAFRLDPAYLAELGSASVAGLPAGTPFRITFFFAGYGFGYHVGFADIARGGWRTVICRNHDDLLTNAATVFKENFVLAHTQHLKNKDIYEGGSKLVLLMDASAIEGGDRSLLTRLLHKLQRDVFNAFLDIYVTEAGVAKNKNVVDYYRQDEPIELGPDENMHDEMIEEMARMSVRRGYLLGVGVISSKVIGINHKEYGVTSTGLVKFAEVLMPELGIDIRRDSFSVKFTGGPNGDVAGNAMRIMLDRCPGMRIRLILDGTAALSDPEGIDKTALKRIVLKDDLDAFDPAALHPGAFMLFRGASREDGMRVLYRKVTRTPTELKEEWISIDELSRQFGELPFSVVADLFIPGGGRPETINDSNWKRFLQADGTPSSMAICEGANSFITPSARRELQKRGVLLMRDASANKCGVISSSYEIIANLLLDEDEFLVNKKEYVDDVLAILEKRAEDEARLLVQRYRASKRPLTELSDEVSGEIIERKRRLFDFFQRNPDVSRQEAFERAIWSHLPAFLRQDRFRSRLDRLSQKYRSAILAAEIGSSMVYRADHDAEFEDSVRRHVERRF